MRGSELAMSRDLSQLKAQLGQAAQLTFSQAGFGRTQPIERDDVKRWDFGDLPEEITFIRAGQETDRLSGAGHREEKVAIHLFDTREAAQANMRGGVRQLLRFELKEQMKQLEKNLSGQNRYQSQAALQLQTLISPGSHSGKTC